MAEESQLPSGSGSDASFRTRPRGEDGPISCSQSLSRGWAGHDAIPFCLFSPVVVFVTETRENLITIFLYLLSTHILFLLLPLPFIKKITVFQA